MINFLHPPVRCDLTKPLVGEVFDGLMTNNVPEPIDEVYSSRPATVAGQWQGFSDPESGICDFEVSVQRKHTDT